MDCINHFAHLLIRWGYVSFDQLMTLYPPLSHTNNVAVCISNPPMGYITLFGRN